LAAKRFTFAASPSSIATPITTTLPCSRWNSAISGISWMQGTHHVAQKLITTQRPW